MLLRLPAASAASALLLLAAPAKPVPPKSPTVAPGPSTALGGAWTDVPAIQDAPAFQYQVEGTGEGLRFNLRLPREVRLAAWTVQLWVADAALVARRKACIGEVRKTIKEYKDRLVEYDPQASGCPTELKAFLEKAAGALKRFQDYDPFGQTLFIFTPSHARAVEGLGQSVLKRVEDGAGSFHFEGAFKLDKNLDVTAPRIATLNWYLALVPTGEPKARPVRSPWSLDLAEPWSIQKQLGEEQDVLARMSASDAARAAKTIYLATPAGYRLAAPGEVQELACTGAEGIYACPDRWVPLELNQPARPASQAAQLALRIFRNVLAVRLHGGDWQVLPLARYLHSGMDEGYEVLDAQERPTGTYLLLKATGSSRPNSPMGQCGAGQEVDLIWMPFARDGKLQKVRAELIGSCFEGIDAQEPDTSARGHVWEWSWAAFSGGEPAPKRTVTYDPRQPERGLRVQQATLKGPR